MEITVKAKKIKCSPKKISLVINLLKNQKVALAKAQLRYLNKEVAKNIYDLLKSGVTIAKDKGMNLDDCIIKCIRYDQGPALKRRRMIERGRATAIRKRTSHVILILSDNKKDDKIEKNKPIEKRKKDGAKSKSQ